MQTNLLKMLVEELAGEDASTIVDILFNKKDVNEFLIARKMDKTINQIRNILYKLSAEGLVSFIRKKDKRKGWYIYYWTLNSEKCLIKLEQTILRKIKELNETLYGRENKRFYVCKPCNLEVNEETALEHGFSCEECFEVYELADNKKSIKEVKGKIARKNKELKMIQEELEVIRKKTAKKRKRKDKKEKEDKAIEKAEKRKERAKERAKEKKDEEKEKRKIASKKKKLKKGRKGKKSVKKKKKKIKKIRKKSGKRKK